MIKQYWVPLADKKQWNDLLALNQTHQLAHTYEYNLAIQKATGEAIYLYAATAKNFNCVCPYAVRQKNLDDAPDLHTPYGFSGLAIEGGYPGFHELRRKFMAEQGYVCGYMLQHPSFASGCIDGPSEILPGKTGFTINLCDSHEVILSRFSADHRQRYRRWLKEGFVVNLDESKQHSQAFIKLYQEALDLREASSVYNFGEDAWLELIHHPAAYLFYVEEGGVVTAAALFFAYNQFVDYYMSATTLRGKQHTRGLICHAIQFFKAQGNRAIFLGCGVHENDTLHQYKLRFGGKAEPTYSVREIYNHSLYESMCLKYEINPSEVSGYFPKYWAA